MTGRSFPRTCHQDDPPGPSTRQIGKSPTIRALPASVVGPAPRRSWPVQFDAQGKEIKGILRKANYQIDKYKN
jgi:hypothetical protein